MSNPETLNNRYNGPAFSNVVATETQLQITLSDDKIPDSCLEAYVLCSFPEEDEIQIPVELDQIIPGATVQIDRPAPPVFSFRLVTASRTNNGQMHCIVRPAAIIDQEIIIADAFNVIWDLESDSSHL